MDPEGFPSPDWSDVFGEVPPLSRPLHLQLLCGGIGAAEQWLKQQGCAFIANPYVDSAAWLAPALRSLYGSAEHEVIFADSGLRQGVRAGQCLQVLTRQGLCLNHRSNRCKEIFGRLRFCTGAEPRG